MSFWKFGKCSKRASMTKNNFQEDAAPWIVSREFSVISEDSSIWGRPYLKVAAHELFSSVQRTIELFSFVYIATPKIFRIIWSAIFASLETVLPALAYWKLRDFRKILKRWSIVNVAGVLRNSSETSYYKKLKNEQL